MLAGSLYPDAVCIVPRAAVSPMSVVLACSNDTRTLGCSWDR